VAGVGPALLSARAVLVLPPVVALKLARDPVRLASRLLRQHGRGAVWVGLVGRRLAQMPRRHRDNVASVGRQHSVPHNPNRLDQLSPQRRLLLLVEVPRRADSPAQPI